MSKATRHYWGATIRVVITVGILLLIFRNIDLQGVLQVILRANPGWLALAVVFQLLSTLLAGYRWYLVMHQLDFGQSPLFYVKSYFKGTFFNQGLPTSIGGDAIRVLDVAGTGFRKRDAFTGVFIDRVLGLTGLLILNLLANLLAPDVLPQGLHSLLTLLIVSGIVGFITLIFIHKLKWFERWRLSRYFLRISSALMKIMHGVAASSKQMGLGVTIHLLSMMNIFTIGHSVGLEYDLLIYIVIVPPAILLTLIPISLAGWGVREGALIGLFTLIGADKATVLSMSILYGIILIIASLPGLQIYLAGKRHTPGNSHNLDTE